MRGLPQLPGGRIFFPVPDSFHKDLSCHTFSLRVDEIARCLEESCGPEFRIVVFECCQGISGRFQKHALETGVQVHFVER